MALSTQTIILLTFPLLLTNFTEEPTMLRKGKDYALFFAVKDYDEWGELKNPVSDAVMKELKKGGIIDSFIVAENSEYILYKNGYLLDKRDTQQYKTIELIGKIWMAENLNIKVPGSYCYDDEPAKCLQFGRLYSRKAAINACPKGWRLPTSEEWGELIRLARNDDDVQTAYKALIQGGNAGFDVLLGGYRNENGKYRHLNSSGRFWERPFPIGSKHSLSCDFLGNRPGIMFFASNYEIRDAFSCRCIKAD